MFILNAFCCSSEAKQLPLSNKNLPVNKKQVHIITNKLSSPVSIKAEPELSKAHLTPETQLKSSNSIQKFVGGVSVELAKSDKSSFGSEELHSLNDLQSSQSAQKQPSTNHSSEFIQTYHSQTDLSNIMGKTLYDLEFINLQVKQWSIKNVIRFLSRIGLKNYTKEFYQNKIKGKDLISLSEKQLKEDLNMSQNDVKILIIYIHLLKQRSDREKQYRPVNHKFSSGHRRLSSFYSPRSNTYSCKRILNMVKNPIMEEESQEDITMTADLEFEQENAASCNRGKERSHSDYNSGSNRSQLFSH